MKSKLSELVNIYKEKKTNDKKLFRYENPHNLEFYNTKVDDFDITLKQMRIDLKYMIFLFISDNNKIILTTPIMEADRNLNNEFEEAKQDIESLSIEDFIEKYYEGIKKFL